MARFRRVADLWNWLPGFRGVAEHESVQEAAAVLNVSASALSRTVKLLESALDAPLFVRHAAGLKLTPLGSELLTVTRNIMRQVDDCIAAEERRRGGAGPLYVGVTSALASAVVARALAIELDGGGAIHVVPVDEDAVADELLHGNLDLVVTNAATRPASLTGCRLGELGFAAFASAGHALAARRPLTIDELGEAAFVAVRGLPEVGEHPAVILCDAIEVAIRLCAGSPRVCVLPDVEWPPLIRLAEVGEPIALHALYRTPLASGRQDARLAALVERLAAAARAGAHEGADHAAL